jgi:LuxR family transcriptional regulator, quorum-sensing system regulator SolR
MSMNTWREQVLVNLHSAHTPPDVFEWVAQYGKELGFDHCAYGLRAPLPVSRTPISILSNYSETWQNRYKEKNYLAIDPTVKHALNSSAPIVWSSQEPGRSEFWKDAWNNGLCYGWTQSSRKPNGAVGMLTFSRRAEKITTEELDRIEPRLGLLTHTAHSIISNLLIPLQIPEAAQKLSPRECEVLRWTAEGKTCNEIGLILGLSERTINFHVNNAMTKLHASNKTHAAVKAALLGML